jgi:predicted phosphodiesterase
LVIVLNSGSICGPPGTCKPTELLCCKQGLLKLKIVKRSELTRSLKASD